jgi:hypothetical protein
MYPEDAGDYSFSPIDPQMTVLRFRLPDRIGAVLVNFGCHPVTGGRARPEDHYKISADYVYYVRQTIAEQYACPVLFTLGAAGDAVPINRYGDCRQRIGGTLGNAAILAERRYAPDPAAKVGARVMVVEAETIVETDPQQAEAEYHETRAKWRSLQGTSEAGEGSEAYRQAAEAYSAAMNRYVRAQLYPDNRGRIPVQFLRLGGTVFVALSFEVLSELSLKMKEQTPNSVLVSCAGGYQGYLPLAYEYERGGYEASERSTHFVPGTADRLLQTILDELQSWPD